MMCATVLHQCIGDHDTHLEGACATRNPCWAQSINSQLPQVRCSACAPSLQFIRLANCKAAQRDTSGRHSPSTAPPLAPAREKTLLIDCLVLLSSLGFMRYTCREACLAQMQLLCVDPQSRAPDVLCPHGNLATKNFKLRIARNDKPRGLQGLCRSQPHLCSCECQATRKTAHRQASTWHLPSRVLC